MVSAWLASAYALPPDLVNAATEVMTVSGAHAE
jgi:hypothetical protein